jgi:hypothetical protein
MSMHDYERAVALIRANASRSDFDGRKDVALIEAAESAVGVRFPPTYRRFLLEYGCGNIAGREFYGIIDENFEDSGIPDGVWLTVRMRREAQLPRQLILVAETGDGGYYAIDTSRIIGASEPPVVLWWPNLGAATDKPQEISPDFGSFLYEQVAQATGGE